MPINAQTSDIGREIPYYNILPILLIIAVLVIISLASFLVYYLRRFHKTQESLVRYITFYLNVKDHVSADERSIVNNKKEPVTTDNFIQIMNRMLKRMMLMPLFILFVFPVSAQSQSVKMDSVFEFLFVLPKNIFFVPYENNQSELKRLSLFVEQYRKDITDGKMPLHVDGYCSFLSGKKENLNVARLHSCRVKSELILHSGIREEYFITRNHAEGGDYVSVRIMLVAEPKKTVETGVLVVKEVKPIEIEQVYSAAPTSEESISDVVSVTTMVEKTIINPFSVSLRTNLLSWATLTPYIGIDWRIDRNWSVLVNGSWTSLGWDNKNCRYALWEVAPDIYYVTKATTFNDCFVTTGCSSGWGTGNNGWDTVVIE